MNPSSAAVTPLRQRMLDDMRMRKLEPKTQASYVLAVRKLTGSGRPDWMVLRLRTPSVSDSEGTAAPSLAKGSERR